MAQPIDGFYKASETVSPHLRLVPSQGTEEANPPELVWVEIDGIGRFVDPYAPPHDVDEGTPEKIRLSHGSVEEQMRFAQAYIPAIQRDLGYSAVHALSGIKEPSERFTPDPRNHHHEPGFRL